MTTRPLTVRQVAERVGISRYAVYDAIRDGKLIALRFSPKLIRVEVAEVERWLSGASTKWGALPSASSTESPLSDTETRQASSADASLGLEQSRKRERSSIDSFAAGKL